jgi:Rrf2 family protein
MTLLAYAPDDRVSSERIAVSTGANAVYVRRVLGRLRNAGFVSSIPGVHGGWRLARDAAEITLGDVWRVIEGGEGLLGVHAANPDCPVGRDIQQTLGVIDRRAAMAVQATLDRITVAELTPATAAQLRQRLATA